jgi:hypothetical protein
MRGARSDDLQGGIADVDTCVLLELEVGIGTRNCLCPHNCASIYQGPWPVEIFTFCGDHCRGDVVETDDTGCNLLPAGFVPSVSVLQPPQMFNLISVQLCNCILDYKRGF